jgi:predicted secreted protein
MNPTVAPWLRTISALCIALAALPASAEAPPAATTNQLTLSATASIDVTRDLLAITFSAQREGADAAVVQSQLAQALEPALAEARKIARPGQVEVSSGNFAVFPRYAPKGGATTWQGSAELHVEGRDVDSITRLVGRIQSMSVARVGYSLSREARDKVQGEVSAQAIARFRSQAEAYARAFGFGAITLRAVELSTNESSVPPMPMFRAAAAATPMAGESLPVESGKASVTATVSGSVQMK